jgi:hypothetical protein
MSAAAKPIDSRAHCPECMCPHCERSGTGYFAQMAVLAGDDSAADKMSSRVYRFLLIERVRRTLEDREDS